MTPAAQRALVGWLASWAYWKDRTRDVETQALEHCEGMLEWVEHSKEFNKAYEQIRRKAEE